MARRIRIILVVLSAWPLAAWAGPPFLTDDPDPVAYGHLETIPFYSMDRAADGETLQGPVMDLSYGVFPGAHLNIETGFVHAMPAAGIPAFGFSDTRVALKWRFLDEGAERPEIALYPAVIFPTGSASRGLGNGQVSYQFPVWLEKNWGDWSSYGGGGWTLNRAAGQRDYFYGGWQVQRKLGDSLFLGAEVYSQGAVAQGSPGYTALNAGGGYALTPSTSFIFTFGHSFAGASHALAFIGFDLEW